MTRIYYIILAFMILVSSCAVEESNVTEIGNPKTTGKGTATALTDHVAGLVAAVAVSATETSRVAEPLNQVITSCSWNQTGRIITCSCARVGTVVTTYDNAFAASSSTLTFDSPLTTVFDTCAFDSCGDLTIVDGELPGVISGSFNTDSNTGAVAVDYASEGNCDDLYFDASGVGVDFTVTYDGTAVDASGYVCLNGEDTEFASLADLDEQLDPEGTCE